MFNDGYDAFCHQVINFAPLGFTDPGVQCGCTQYLRQLEPKERQPQLAKRGASQN